jgi:rhodanese-related sulfurtransferase
MEPIPMKSITPTELAAMEGATLIDVREQNEVDEVRVDGAIVMPMSTFQEHLDELPDGPLHIMCHAGGRSARVTQFLEQQGYDATNVEGGITQWEAEGLPVVR